MIKNYDSSITTPQVIFLGLDEARKENGMGFKSYVGTPYFALDVTPKGTIEEKANGVIAEMEKKGLSFDTGRMVMSLSAEEGMDSICRIIGERNIFLTLNAPPQPLSTPKPAPS